MSLNDRMVWVGRAFKLLLFPLPWYRQGPLPWAGSELPQPWALPGEGQPSLSGDTQKELVHGNLQRSVGVEMEIWVQLAQKGLEGTPGQEIH